MDIKPKVTVVIPSYNYAEKISTAIQSVMDQTLSNFECFIVDDGSEDNTAEVVLAKIYQDFRFNYVHQDNQGVSVARNHGISLGDAPYICCLDADDSIAPQFLEVCVDALDKDRLLGIAYTSILAVDKNGRSTISQWPGEYNYDEQLQGRNQIPTCCVFRRKMWERLGGYRSRYCPIGAGSEDAEFWLRAGAYGFPAKKVSQAGLFVYSLGTGRVSGNRQYHEVNWRDFHPWTKDDKHPIASCARPKRFSHPVRQYDHPQISVVIPVGPNHRKNVFEALDSLEAQSFRSWEAVVVDDSGGNGEWEFDGFPDAWRAYPYARIINTGGKKGAGFARNRGVEAARADMILFLDSDDTLVPDALEEMVKAWNTVHSIVYSDYYGKAVIGDDPYKSVYQNTLEHYDPKTGIAVIRYASADFDCNKAVRQPDSEMYIWNLITSLVPKSWHEEIGGFDENMVSWEDWDYWIRHAKNGKCFYRIPKHLVVYRFYTGTRREDGLQAHQSLIEYLVRKQRGIKSMPCSSCPGSGAHQAVNTFRTQQNQRSTIAAQQSPVDAQFVLCVYKHPNTGQHSVVGGATGQSYGHRGGGETFYVHEADVRAQPDLYQPIQINTPIKEVLSETPPPKEINPPAQDDKVNRVTAEERVQNIIEKGIENIDEIEDITVIPGITPSIAAELNARGCHSIEDIAKLTKEQLLEIKGVGESKAAAILAFCTEYTKRK